MKVLVNEFGYLGAIYLFTWFSVKFTFSKTENLNVKEMIVFVFVVFYLNNLYTTGMVVLYVLYSTDLCYFYIINLFVDCYIFRERVRISDFSELVYFNLLT